jgi:hypothetical protein
VDNPGVACKYRLVDNFLLAPRGLSGIKLGKGRFLSHRRAVSLRGGKLPVDYDAKLLGFGAAVR